MRKKKGVEERGTAGERIARRKIAKSDDDRNWEQKNYETKNGVTVAIIIMHWLVWCYHSWLLKLCDVQKKRETISMWMIFFLNCQPFKSVSFLKMQAFIQFQDFQFLHHLVSISCIKVLRKKTEIFSTEICLFDFASIFLDMGSVRLYNFFSFSRKKIEIVCLSPFIVVVSLSNLKLHHSSANGFFCRSLNNFQFLFDENLTLQCKYMLHALLPTEMWTENETIQNGMMTAFQIK